MTIWFQLQNISLAGPDVGVALLHCRTFIRPFVGSLCFCLSERWSYCTEHTYHRLLLYRRTTLIYTEMI